MNHIPNLEKPLLAIDTSTPACSIALRIDGEIIEKTYLGKDKHTKVILPMIDLFLTQARITAQDLAGIIVSIGPGAFTGLRVGAAVANGLALGANIPVGCLSSLALLAAGVKEANKTVLALFDARMTQVYAGLYDSSNMQLLDKELLISPEAISDGWLAKTDVIVGPGLVYADKLGKHNAKIIPELLPEAKDAFVALNMVQWQDGFEPIDLHYLRDDITQHD